MFSTGNDEGWTTVQHSFVLYLVLISCTYEEWDTVQYSFVIELMQDDVKRVQMQYLQPWGTPKPIEGRSLVGHGLSTV